MATVNNANPVFYPAFCFKASPTHFAWVKMAAADVHRLRRRKGFEGQNIFFYNNHPICFVSVAGVIVARTEITRRTILTVDDSSGATIDVAVLRSDDTKGNGSGKEGQPFQTQAASRQTAAASTTAAAATIAATGSDSEILSMHPTHISATDRTALDISNLKPGTTVRVKGTLSTFRSTMQLHLERYSVISSTNAEMQFVDERLRFLVEVLSVPWQLDDEEVEQLRCEAERDDLQALEERRRAERRAKRKIEREEREQRHLLKRYEREEKRREKEAGVCREESVRAMGEIRRRKGESSLRES